MRSTMCGSSPRPNRRSCGAGSRSSELRSSVASLGQLARPGVEFVELLELHGRQRFELAAEPVDLLAQLAERGPASCRERRLRLLGCLLLERLDRGLGELRVISTSGLGELVDREVFVVAFEHLSRDARK